MPEDPAFVWERLEGPTPGPPLRRTPPRPKPATVAAPEIKWVTLREAADDTGIAVSTLRNWARKGRVTSRIEDRVEGPRRIVDLASVRDHAAALGRLDQVPTAVVTPATPPAPPDPVPEGHMLVPMDAWDKMVMQLGNLHEAGQQLADARERAAKAETEAAFLRERVADLRAERDEARAATAETPVDTSAPPESLWARLYRSWQRRSSAP